MFFYLRECYRYNYFSALANARAAELIMFEQAGCAWCETFDREIAPIYPKTAEGQRACLRRVNIDRPIPPDLAFIEVERLAPVFVQVHNSQEIGRIRGYPGEDHFWGLLGALMKELDAVGQVENQCHLSKNRCAPLVDRLYSGDAATRLLVY